MIADDDPVFLWPRVRLDETVTIEECFTKIAEKDFEYLRKYDQLNLERERGKVFPGWKVRGLSELCGLRILLS